MERPEDNMIRVEGYYRKMKTANSNNLRKITKFILIALMILILAGILIILFFRTANYMHHKMMYKGGVNETTYLDINGQQQYVSMMGENTSNPVIIYLHGGPSSPDTFISYCFSDYLTDEYTVIAWDQRGCGRTYFKNEKTDPDNQTATFEQALEDLDVLVSYACDRFEQDKVIIMGHSYGTVLGSVYAKSHAEKVQAYIGVGQLVSLADADMYSYNDAMEKAKAAGDDTSTMEKAYEEYCQNPGIPNLLSLRNQTSIYHPVEKHADQFGLALFSPYAGIDDLRWFLFQMGDINKYVDKNKQLFDFVLSFDACKESMDFSMPVCLISGSEDWVCPVQKAEQYLKAISAPMKKMYKLEGFGHDTHCADPEEFAKDVKEFLDGCP
ncbi:alpha/beta fold hydrolase [Butyrivibrio sp. WCE2006]|uniref:alpha/beta fold hydrolase n=1 Tax=Butyrivibrio sp. WCE2006 TaxID=1410611 RepID=UPI0005D2A753|nr:alpha/beta hydrolase [Butyrivibrio sp. WCE2006]